MNLTILLEDGKLFNIIVNDSDTVFVLKKKISEHCKISPNQQCLYCNDLILEDSSLLKNYNIKNYDVVMTRKIENLMGTGNMGIDGLMGDASTNLQATSNTMSNNNYFQQPNFISFDQFCNGLRTFNPSLFETSGNNEQQVNQMLRNSYAKFQEEQKKIAELDRLAQLNPYEREVQERIEKVIRQKQIEEQLFRALEYNPESFGVVSMLYINTEVNKHAVKAFVDSGAQNTIMSQECANRCGIINFMDTNHAGVASGVGSGKIMGRVHSCMLKIGSSFYETAIYIIEESKIEFLFGLDLLKRHRCVIDLSRNVLVVGEDTVPFLGESEINERVDVVVDSPKKLVQMTPSILCTENQMDKNNVQNNCSENEQKISQLTGLGYSRSKVIEALEVCDGNVDMAAVYLTN